MKANKMAGVVAVLLTTTLSAAAFGPHPPVQPHRAKTTSTAKPKTHSYTREVYAVWYRVPPDSLARRRAGRAELTAAHNRLPLGTLLRVTNLKNGKSVIVRVTDRGITDKLAKIDICKEAAEQIDMVSEGIVRVRLEIVAETPQANSSSPSRVAAH